MGIMAAWESYRKTLKGTKAEFGVAEMPHLAEIFPPASFLPKVVVQVREVILSSLTRGKTLRGLQRWGSSFLTNNLQYAVKVVLYLGGPARLVDKVLTARHTRKPVVPCVHPDHGMGLSKYTVLQRKGVTCVQVLYLQAQYFSASILLK